MPFVISFVKVLELLPFESTSAQTLEFLTVFVCWLGLQTPQKKKKQWVSKAFGFPKTTSFLFLRFGSAVREREREVVGEDVVGWWAGGFAGSSHAASI